MRFFHRGQLIYKDVLFTGQKFCIWKNAVEVSLKIGVLAKWRKNTKMADMKKASKNRCGLLILLGPFGVEGFFLITKSKKGASDRNPSEISHGGCRIA